MLDVFNNTPPLDLLVFVASKRLTAAFIVANCLAMGASTHPTVSRAGVGTNALGHDFADHVAVDVGEAAVEAVVVPGEALVVEAEQVQDRGVEVPDGGHRFE